MKRNTTLFSVVLLAMSSAVYAQNDVAINSIALPKFNKTSLVAVTGTKPKINITNSGTAPITSLDVQYTVDGGAAITESFTALNIASQATADLDFKTGLASLTPGSHTIEVNATAVNGGADANAGNNKQSTAFLGASQAVTKAGLIEEFSSSTCGPCASFNVTFDPLVVSNNANNGNSNFNVIKYQMNWPQPNNDPAYNQDGATRKGFYGVSGIPMHFTNGMQGGSGEQDEIDAAKADAGYLNIEGSYIINGDSLSVNASVTPYVSKSGFYKVYIALVETGYDFPGAATSQKRYVYVMRKMFPGGNGKLINPLVEGKTSSYSYSDQFKVGGVAQGNYNFWTHPMNSALLVFIQDGDGTILQSKSFPAQFPTGVATIAGNVSQFTVYPNPAVDNATLGFTLSENTRIQVQVLDAVGRVVNTISNQEYQAGKQQITISTAALSTGTYIIKLQTEKGAITQRLSVVK